jgi:hypothetical protein
MKSPIRLKFKKCDDYEDGMNFYGIAWLPYRKTISFELGLYLMEITWGNS